MKGELPSASEGEIQEILQVCWANLADRFNSLFNDHR
jgi:hypothetical protein